MPSPTPEALVSLPCRHGRARADKPVVRELAERLHAARLRVWLDEWVIKPGDLISTKTVDGLEHSAVLLLSMSTNAFGSDWVSLQGHTALFRDPLNRDPQGAGLRGGTRASGCRAAAQGPCGCHRPAVRGAPVG